MEWVSNSISTSVSPEGLVKQTVVSQPWKFRFSRSGVVLKNLQVQQLPGDANAVGLRTTFEKHWPMGSDILAISFPSHSL